MITALCPECSGAGSVDHNLGYPDPQCAVTDPCPTCHGNGEIEICANCERRPAETRGLCERCWNYYYVAEAA